MWPFAVGLTCCMLDLEWVAWHKLGFESGPSSVIWFKSTTAHALRLILRQESGFDGVL